MINRVRGTRDLLDLNLKNFILDEIKKHVKNYNFIQIQTPILEYTKLFSHSLGEQTDVVSKEMYTFPCTNEQDSICLRPEATASVIRAYFENKIEAKPWKVFSVGSMFRRERPQKGRWREFAQLNFEIVNSEVIAQDAQFIKMLDSFFNEKMNLENYILKLNFLGCMDDRKKHKHELRNYLTNFENEVCPTCAKRIDTNILRIFDCKNSKCQTIYNNAPRLINYLCQDCSEEWKELQELLNLLAVNFIIDSKLVRGLDYYNKTVFEFSSADLGAQDAFCGGGRYSLGKGVGAKQNYPSIGAAIGFGRFALLVQKNLDNLKIPQSPPLYLVLPMTEEQHKLALFIAQDLRNNDLCTDVLLDIKSIKNMMRKANKLGAKKVIILGQDEQENNTATIKNMQTGNSITVSQTEITNNL